MAEEFDPYRKWLGIPREDYPPNHYRLLGVGLFESDLDVISNAADRQMAHVRTFQSGKYSRLSQELLNELSAARVCLLDAQRKNSYNEQLRAKLAAANQPPVASTPPPPRLGVSSGPSGGVGVPPVTPQPAAFGIQEKRSEATAYHDRRKKSSWQVPVVIVVMVLMMLGLLVIVLNNSPDEAPRKRPSASTERHPGLNYPPPPRKDPSAGKHRPKRDRQQHPPRSVDDGRDVTDPVQASPSESSDTLGEIRGFTGHGAPVDDAFFSPDGLFILSGSEDKSVRLWDVGAGHELRRFEGATGPVSAVAISSDGQHVAAASGQLDPPIEGAIRIWETAGGREITRIDTSSVKLVHDIKFSDDGKHLFLAGHDNTVRLIDLSSGEEVRSFSGHTGPVRSVAVSSNGQLMLSGSDDGTVRLWNRFSGKEMRCLTGHVGPVGAVAFQSKSRFGLSGGADKTVRLWNLNSGRQPCEMLGHTGPVSSVACTADGTRALSGSLDGTIRLWQLPDGKQLVYFDAHSGGVRSVSFSPSGHRAVSAGSDTVVRLWGLPEDIAPAARNPTDQEDPDALLPSDDIPQPKLPAAPNAAAQQQAENLIKTEVFKADFEAAAKPSKKAELIEKLFDKGVATEDNPTASYVLLRMARDMAAEAGDADTALAAVEEMGRQFDISMPEAKAVVLDTAVKATHSPSGRKLLIEEMFSLIDEAVEVDNHALAGRVILLVRATTAKARDGALAKRVATRAQQIQELKKSYQPVRQALEIIDKQPDDAQANEVLGKYFCFGKGQWDEGLPKLAKAADQALKESAATDLAGPEEPDQQLALADRWWAIAEKQANEAQQRQIKRRAALWYGLAEPNLTGEPKTRAQNRLTGITGATKQTAPVALPKVDDLKCREEPAKSALLKALGGTQTSEAAVQLALEWLANHQRPDGSWNFNHDGPRCKGRCRNPGDMKEAPNSATALALLPFLGAGERPRGGKYRKNVFTAVQFLKKRMVALSPTVATLYEPRAHQIPSHALGTMALCEASFDDRDRTTRLAAQAAVNFIVATQQDDGGWSWRPKLREGERGEPSGISATGWNLMALETAKWADLKVPAKTTEAVDRFLDSLQSQDKKAYSRQPNSHPDSQSTSVALFCRMLLGCPRDDSQIVEFVQTLGDRGPGRRADLFAKYHNTLLMMNFGGPAWQKWNPVVRDSLIAEQSHADHETGSWFMPGDGRNRHGGRLYCTALATLILESYYRYPPFYSGN